MSDDNKDSSTDVSLDKFQTIMDEKIGGLAKVLQDGNAKLVQSVAELKQVKTESKVEDDDDDWNLDDDSDDEKITQVVEKKSKEIERKVEEKFDNLNRIQIERNKYDTLAFNTYPELNDPNSKFGKAVKSEIDQIIQEQISTYGLKESPEDLLKKDPRVLWNASARVAAKNPEFRDKALVDNIKKQLAKQGGGYSFTPREKNTGGPNQNQIRFAQRLGMSPDKLANQMKKRGY